jgi:hypothetical protein
MKPTSLLAILSSAHVALAEPTDSGAPATGDSQPKPPKRGDFDAGGQIRLPNGPDAMGQYATYNWIALDAKARYDLLDSVTADGLIPLAVKKPDQLMDGRDPKMIGGISARLDAKLPSTPQLPFTHYETEIGLSLTAAYMHDGAMLLSDKDFPVFTGDYKPGFAVGPIAKVKLSTVVDFAMTPVFVYQGGLEAVQLPTSLIVKLGSLVQASADVGVYTGNDFTFGGDGGGRIATGGALTVKLGPILAHAGAGFASLLTGPAYRRSATRCTSI